MKKILCWIFGHRYYITKRWSNVARRLSCHWCHGDWAMHDPTKSLVPMDGDIAELYGDKYP